jgi:hypothetical protein
MSIDVLEAVVNHITDKDGTWWPFVWLRPAKHTKLSLARLASIAFLFGLPFGVLLAIIVSLAFPHARSVGPSLAGGFPLFFFFVSTVLIGPMWNRRAKRLRDR